MIKSNYAIIGGGVAGLSAAIRLSELGERPIVIEGGSYPSDKVCGEFLSSECLPYLERWQIRPVPISRVIFRTTTNCLSFPFPDPAGGLSHRRLDPSLADYAVSHGAKILTNTSVVSFREKSRGEESHRIMLSSGEGVEASHVIVATGRIPGCTATPPPISYMGFKTHFDNGISPINHLEMFSFKGAYLGISPVEDGRLNVACLADLKEVNEMDPLEFIEKLIAKNAHLHALLSKRKNLFKQWMVARVPEFGIKSTPDWPDAYFIGDAAVTVPPACGNGLSLAILGGRLAAEFAIRRKSQAFKTLWNKKCGAQVFWAKRLHQVMLNPTLGNLLIPPANYFPSIGNKVYALTRQSACVEL